MPLVNIINSLIAKLHDKDGNGITSTEGDGGKRLLDVNAQFEGSIGTVKIEGADGLYEAIVDSSGNLYVNVQSIPNIILRDGITETNLAKVDGSGNIYTVSPAPETPAGKTSIGHADFETHSGITDHTVIIPTGEEVTIQRFKAGAEYDSNGGSVFSLWYDPNGNGVGMEIIEAIFANGISSYVDLNYVTPIGDGTKSIRLRCEHLGGGTVLEFHKWEGYY